KEERPLKVFTGNFGSRQVAVIETVFETQYGGHTPTRSMDDYLAHLPFLAGRYTSHREYSTNNIEMLLGELRQDAKEWRATELRSVVLLNRKGYFEMRPLPWEAQLAPVFGITVSDFDLDGLEDLFLAQNFFANRTGVPRHDAGRGLLLRGDGTGGFRPVPGQISGIAVYGEQRGSATCDFDHDGRPDLVVTQNAAETKLYRNEGLTRGLRVRINGGSGNPNGAGCIIRLKSANGFTPAREIHAGSGYWSQDSAVPILAIPPEANRGPLELELRRPGGGRRLITAPSGLKEVQIDF
ncbi:MAG TPA: VCBS repeat-containing protein, partial [Candidatus Kapabacteria bacterium]|nr:VCBS repeat-containing protein [Candidatus Kapabacteria bacterium]